ncbi:MAG: hypothetical protein JXM70_00400 [Pirellulales bacterium]|nr:hypothetical protein [Pirellulales bacterium]
MITTKFFKWLSRWLHTPRLQFGRSSKYDNEAGVWCVVANIEKEDAEQWAKIFPQ